MRQGSYPVLTAMEFVRSMRQRGKLTERQMVEKVEEYMGLQQKILEMRLDYAVPDTCTSGRVQRKTTADARGLEG